MRPLTETYDAVIGVVIRHGMSNPGTLAGTMIRPISQHSLFKNGPRKIHTSSIKVHLVLAEKTKIDIEVTKMIIFQTGFNCS